MKKAKPWAGQKAEGAAYCKNCHSSSFKLTKTGCAFCDQSSATKQAKTRQPARRTK